MDDENTLYRYVGPDTFPGIPAHDLTQADYDRLPILRQLDVQANASYELVVEEVNLTTMTKDELVSIAESKGLDAEGTKAELIERIEKGANS